jgi:hypothetical protein
VSSTSLAAPGTGLVYVPIYFSATASAVGSITYYNGTGGSALFFAKMAAGGGVEFAFWEQPSRMSANKAPNLISETDNIGTHDAHVYMIVVRAAAGSDGLGQ